MFIKRKKNQQEEMSFLEHLEELRWHLVRAVIGLVVAASGIFFSIDFLFEHVILAPREPGFLTNQLLCRLSDRVSIPALCINQKPFEIINISMSGQFTMHIWVSIIGGFILAFPYIIYELWTFIRPALRTAERQKANSLLGFISLLFLFGVAFGYFVLLPLSLHFLGSYSVSESISNQITLNSYISTLSSITLATGLIFEMPVVVYFLARIGILSSAFLKKHRRLSIVLNLVIAAIITPPDVFSQILVSLPLFGLYEAGIMVARRVERKNLAKP